VGAVAQEDVDDLIHRREVHAFEPTRPPSEHCLIASTKICWLSRLQVRKAIFVCYDDPWCTAALPETLTQYSKTNDQVYIKHRAYTETTRVLVFCSKSPR
jgi:hypothetical protein